MLYNKTCNRFWVLAITCLLISHSAAIALSLESVRPSVSAFLSKFTAPQRERLLNGLVFNERGNIVSNVELDGSLYSLVIVGIPRDSEPDVAAELEAFALERALFLARGRLAFSLGQGGVDRRLYRYDDALGTALFSYYTRPREQKVLGIEAEADVIKTDDDLHFAVALAWLRGESVKELKDDVPPSNILDEDYCRFLYRERARVLFEAKNYAEALPFFKNIHDFRWADVNAYMDAAECFLKTGQAEECSKLLREVRGTLNDKMGSDALIRTGRLFREAGDRSAALSAFREARERYRKGK